MHITIQNEQRVRVRRQHLPELFRLTGAKKINFGNVLLKANFHAMNKYRLPVKHDYLHGFISIKEMPDLIRGRGISASKISARCLARGILPIERIN